MLLALARARDAEAAEDRRRRRAIADANDAAMTRRKLNAEIHDAEEKLKKRKKQVAEEEAILEAKHCVKQFRLAYLGDGVKACGGAWGRNRREEVLDRMARLGTGLSPTQRNDWPWFKEAWEREMMQTHGEAWVRVFAGWLQGVLNELQNGSANAFSVFVHRETCRCFDDVPALHVPPS